MAPWPAIAMADLVPSDQLIGVTLNFQDVVRGNDNQAFGCMSYYQVVGRSIRIMDGAAQGRGEAGFRAYSSHYCCPDSNLVVFASEGLIELYWRQDS
jgi:hypothetical protein